MRETPGGTAETLVCDRVESCGQGRLSGAGGPCGGHGAESAQKRCGWVGVQAGAPHTEQGCRNVPTKR